MQQLGDSNKNNSEFKNSKYSSSSKSTSGYISRWRDTTRGSSKEAA
jgi:hypothetical protein